MKCYKLTAHLRSGFSSADPWSPSIDSILAYFQLKKEMGAEYFNISTAMEDQTTCETLPIERTFFKDLWWYQCSCPEYDCKQEIKRQYYKKFNIDYSLMIDKKVKNIELTKNQYKNYSLYFAQIIVDKVSWHMNCDIEKVMKLLSTCNQIGSKRSKGMGEVLRWSYEEGDQQKALLERPLPVEYAENNNINGLIMLRGFRPSFRIVENQTLCIIRNKME